MIVKIEGKIISVNSSTTKGSDSFSLDVMTSSGVAYRALLGMAIGASSFSVDQDVSLFTSYQVREDSQTLYGFNTAEDRDFFEVLIGVSGVGPKTALNMLSIYTITEVKQMILEGDHKGLSRTSGLGPKGAKKIILELAGILTVDEDSLEDEMSSVLKDISDAMKALGFSGAELDSMVDRAKEISSESPDIGIEGLIQMVLQGR